MMLVTLIAVMCRVLPEVDMPHPRKALEKCVDAVVADSRMNESLNLMSCMMLAPSEVTHWMSEHPLYNGRIKNPDSSTAWQFTKWLCVSGELPAKL